MAKTDICLNFFFVNLLPPVVASSIDGNHIRDVNDISG